MVTFTELINLKNEYVYFATGKKFAVIHKASTENRTDYVGNMIYENSSLMRILIDGGYIENGVYHFYLQDHLGNNRVVAKSDGTVVQTNHYYPFGMSFAESTQTSNQPYRYNGKELDTENGLNWYDYEARQMEVALGRFSTVDPLSEKYYAVSPYVYCQNNPIFFTDPTGMFSSPYYDINGAFLGVDEKGFAGNIFVTDRATFDKYSKEGISDSRKLQADNNTKFIKDATLSFQAESKVYTHVLQTVKDPIFNMSQLYNGEISILDKAVMRPDGTKIGKGYNNPAPSNTQAKFTQSSIDNQIRVTASQQSNRTDLFTVESIWSFLGIHEYWGHGIKRWNNGTNHWR